MRRKIIKQGNNTLTMTLPREWTNEFSIKSGDELELQIKGKALILSTEKLLSQNKKTEDISRLTQILPLFLLSVYRKGYDEVELQFENQHTSIIIENIINNNFTGFHIIDQKKNSCTIKSMSDVNEMDFNEILRKLFLLIKMKLEKISDSLSKKDISDLQQIIAMNGMPSKITNFCHRLISKRNIENIENIHHLYSIVTNLENLDNQLNHLISAIMDLSQKTESPEIISIIKDFSRLYSDFYSCYFDFDLHKLVILMNRKNILSGKLDSIFDESKDSSKIFLNLNNSLIYMNSLMSVTLIMEV